ncbi:MAG: flagellar biosynthesis regulator FlaF [Alphaproteobacteria bacterium]|nr:flagellar biosynthesis regulator FlaF [Alphaproteobacteria bacterium]
MNAAVPQNAAGAYGKSNRSTRSPRETERDVIARVTHQLRSAKEKRSDGVFVVRAISDNLSLWYVLMTDLANDNNTLPVDLRAKLLSLGMTVVRECEQVDRTRVNIDFLIEINQSIMDGLTETSAP